MEGLELENEQEEIFEDENEDSNEEYEKISEWEKRGFSSCSDYNNLIKG